MKIVIYICSGIMLAGIIITCKKPFTPVLPETSNNYLVVEGVIVTGADSTKIKLSRTISLTANVNKPETKATVTVEDDKNKSYTLNEITTGTYAAPLGLNTAGNYRLRIKTSAGIVYLSDYSQAKTTPAIDSVGFNINSAGDGIGLYINTHDAANNTRYYRWEYEETWRFHVTYQSLFKTNGTAIVPRSASDQVYFCFGSAVSSNVITGSSVKLSQDVIFQQPLTSIEASSEKISVRYSILLKQYALNQDAYNFWAILRTNTEQLGSIFDAQPSEQFGNIHCVTTPSLPVIGYISASTVQSKRIFIDKSQLPSIWQPSVCNSLDTVWYCLPKTNPCYNEVALSLVPLSSTETPVYDLNTKGAIYAFMSASRQCADCTIRGVVKQPPFWK